MKFTILIPHYKQGQATAHAIYKCLKHKGKHDITIVVIDNSHDDSIEYITKPDGLRYIPVIVPYPEDKLQSHGIAFDYAILNGHVHTDYFITLESDSFPTEDNWLDYYEYLIKSDIDAAGSLLQLSGGQYLHPCGAMYKTSTWHNAFHACISLYATFDYFPNMIRKDGFDYHVMLRKGTRVNPDAHVLASGYSYVDEEENYKKMHHYIPCTRPFHNGMGAMQETINTYGARNIYTGIEDLRLPKDNVIFRVGYEPGQWFSYFLISQGYKVGKIPTEVKWLPGRENQNQEYTKMENGFTHLWGVSSFHGSTDENMKDVIDFKKNQMNELYFSMPNEFRL